MGRFDGRVALVTGAASGMGRATALRLASEGAAVLGIDVDATGLSETEVLAKEAGNALQTGVYDISVASRCAEAVEACVDAFGRLDVLANVAGILRMKRVDETSEEDWNLVLGVNLSGTFFMSQAAMPHLIESGGNIVNVASVAGLKGQAYAVAYCASKGGIVNLTRAMAVEYLKSGVRINAVAPGGTDTPMITKLAFPEEIDMDLVNLPVVPRPASAPEDIAAVILFLASDEARSVHGAIWSADNGMLAS